MNNDWVNDYLMHHGVLGQKWGVRRYQNKDGSLTLAGRKRLRKEGYKDYADGKKSKYVTLSEYTKDWNDEATIRTDTIYDAKRGTPVSRKEYVDGKLKKTTEGDELEKEIQRDEESITYDRYDRMWESYTKNQKLKEGPRKTLDEIKKEDDADPGATQREIWRLVGNWYHHSARSEKYMKALDSGIADDILDVAIDEMHYENSPELRAYIKELIFWD